MSERALRTMWSFFGALLSSFSLAVAIRVTGTKTMDSILPISQFGSAAAALIGIPIGATLLVVVSWLTLRHAELRGPGRWERRLPVFYFDPGDIDTRTREGRLYQRITFGLFLVFPYLVLVKLLHRFSEGEATIADAPFARGIEHWIPTNVLDLHSWLADDYRYDGMSYYPILQPWLNLAMFLGVTWVWGRAMRALFRGVEGRRAGTTTG